MKRKILLTAVMTIVVMAIPFGVVKWDKVRQVRAKERMENQNREWYQEVNAYMDSSEYENAIELLKQLPKEYEDTEYILQYAEFCKSVKDKENIEELYRLTWDFPDESDYDGKYAEGMRVAERDIDIQYKEYVARKEKEKREEIKRNTPYKGMEEKYINATILGKAQEKRTEHYWRNTPRQRTQDIQYRYMWYDSNGAKKFMAVCRSGRVSSVVQFVHSSASGSKRNNAGNNAKDMYDVQDYDDSEEFYFDHMDEFEDVQDAEDYWEEAQWGK